MGPFDHPPARLPVGMLVPDGDLLFANPADVGHVAGVGRCLPAGKNLFIRVLSGGRPATRLLERSIGRPPSPRHPTPKPVSWRKEAGWNPSTMSWRGIPAASSSSATGR